MGIYRAQSFMSKIQPVAKKFGYTSALVLLGSFVIWQSPAHAQDATKTITIAADEWCPINCKQDKEPLGVGIDLAKAIFGPLGFQVKYVTMPWTRALEEVKKGNVDAVVGANSSDDPNLIFPKTPIYFMTDDFYALKDSKIAFNGMDSMKPYKLGTIKGYGYSASFVDFAKSQQDKPGAVQEASGDDAGEQNIRKLQAKRIDVVVESGPVMIYRLKQMGLEDKVAHIGSLPQDNIYVGFSQAISDSNSRAKLFDDGIAKLKKEGKLKAIYAKYNLEVPAENKPR